MLVPLQSARNARMASWKALKNVMIRINSTQTDVQIPVKFKMALLARNTTPQYVPKAKHQSRPPSMLRGLKQQRQSLLQWE